MEREGWMEGERQPSLGEEEMVRRWEMGEEGMGGGRMGEQHWRGRRNERFNRVGK